ncbi:hypothetical protein ACIRP2_11240 [Streptomyces sp. NPDC101194]|uniref:hypothetical protein n=1 Tax=Streptomyces sp. NPDC101194 TaxID=3366127 RepID=UPI003821FFAC
MKRTRTVVTTTALLVAGLLAVVSGCTSASSDAANREEPRPAGSTTAGRTGADSVPVSDARACRGGTYTWFNTQRLSVLNGVTEAQRVTAAKTVGADRPMLRLRTDMASLDTEGPALGSDAVLGALAVHLGLADEGNPDAAGLDKPGEYPPLDTGAGEFSGPAGHYVSYSAFQLIETDFRYSCGHGKQHEPTFGHVVTATAPVGGILRCEEPLRKHASAAAREAVRLSCGR